MLIYTAVIGSNTDTLRPPLNRCPRCRYVCFTDQNIQSKDWRIVRVNPGDQDPRLFARRIKITCPIWSASFYSLWIDADFAINVPDLSQVIDSHLKNSDVLTFKHPFHKCVQDEANAIVKKGYAERSQIDEQLKRYEGSRQSPMPATGFLLRRHNRRVRSFSETWWNEVQRFPHGRDQVSFNYAATQHDVRTTTLPGVYMRHEYARWNG